MGERRGSGGTWGKWGHQGTRAGGRRPRAGDTRAPHHPGVTGALPPRASVSPCTGSPAQGTRGWECLVPGRSEIRARTRRGVSAALISRWSYEEDFALSSFATVLPCQSQRKPDSNSPEPVLSS